MILAMAHTHSKKERLQKLRNEAQEGGGSHKVQAQHQKGKLTARERVELLLDPGSFQEIDHAGTHD